MNPHKLIGMDPRSSLQIYPRRDEKYKTKGSINFDLLRTKVFRGSPKPPRSLQMLFYCLIGIGTALTAVILTVTENWLIKMKLSLLDEVIGGLQNNLYWTWLYYSAFSAAFAFLTAALVVYVCPEAAQSGTVELQAYLNGVNFSSWFSLRTYAVKAAAMILTAMSGLMVGRAGTFAHFGAIIGMGSLYLPIRGVECFHVNTRKREFVAAGMACGMAVAFGAPVGGALFGFEISSPNTYWGFSSMWRTFLTCMVGVMTYSLFLTAWDGKWLLNSTPLRFTSNGFTEAPGYLIIPQALVIGFVCGLVSAAFISLNTYANLFRKLQYRLNYQKCIECVGVCLVTTTMQFWVPYWCNPVCFKQPVVSTEQPMTYVQYNCPAGYYNPLASLLLNSESLVINAFLTDIQDFQTDLKLSTFYLSIFGLMWFYFSSMTYGSPVPTGVFLSAILIGSSIGYLSENLRLIIFAEQSASISTAPVLIGAACMMSGYTKLTYSVILLMLEATSSTSLVIPLVFAIVTTQQVTKRLTRTSLLDRELRQKQVPFLRGSCPKATRGVKAYQIMNQKLVCLESIASLGSI